MADALAISAAVVQFLDIAVRLTLQLSSLYKEVRDVPERLRRLQVDIDQQITIARYVQSTHATFWHNSPPTSSMPIDQPLADYIAIMEQLVEAVNVITKPNDIGIIHRSWSALRATAKCKEAIALCDALEKKKSNITMWLSTANIELSSEIRRLVDGIDKKIDKTLQSTQRQEETATERDLQSSKLPTLLSELSVNTHSHLSELRNETSSSQQQLLTLTANTEVHVRTLVEQWQELSPTFHEFRDILQHSSHLQQFVHEIAASAQYAAIPDCKTHVPGNGEAIPRVRQHHSCTCREIIQARSDEPTSFLHFRKIFKRFHSRNCPRSKSSATSLEYLVKIIPPGWLLSHTFHLGFCIQFWNSKSSWKICPLIMGGSRRVDRIESPAFQAIRNVRRLNHTPMIQPKDIQGLLQTLKELFAARKASVHDEDHFGSTILFEIMHMYHWRWKPQTPDPCAQDFVSLIQFLLDCGADPNVHRLAELPVPLENSHCYVGGTVLDVFAIPLMCPDPHFRGEYETHPLVYGKLLNSGAYFSRPLAYECRAGISPTFRFGYFKQEMEQLRTFEEQLEVCNLNDLMIAIVQRDEATFNRAMAKDNIHEISYANGLTAIHFAVFWPWALRRLIEAGANINCQDSLERRPIHLATGCGEAEAIMILLEADCSVSTPHYSYSLLQESLRQGQRFDHVTTRIIDALINRHTRLINLALSVLPEPYKFMKLLNKEYIVETDSTQLIDALASHKCDVTPSLEIDRDGEGVYDVADLHARIRMTTALANQLWNGGFRRVDEPALLNSLTPLLQSWFVANFDMVSWFIGKGASPFTKSPLKSHGGLHLFAARIAYPGGHFYQGHRSIPCHEGLIKQLTEDEDMWHDSCRCICSPKGCTPISIAVKQCYPDGERNYEMMLNLSRSLHEKLLYRPEEDFNHIKQLLDIFVFEKLKFRHTCCRIGQAGEIDNISTFHHCGKTVYDGLEAGYQQSLEEFGSKVLQCGCDIIEKPACVVFREECKKGR